MYIYNVTTTLEPEVHEEWVRWMKEEHIPAILNTQTFLSAKMSRVLLEGDNNGITYSVQFAVTDKDKLEKYYKLDAPSLRQEAHQRFGGKAFSFRTELEVVGEFMAAFPVATHLLFTYGTLQEREVQLGVFSRTMAGWDDVLTHYQISNTKVSGLYPTLEFTNNQKHSIQGKVYTLTPKELELADRYEGGGYNRIEVTLASGKKAWAYIAPNH
jgi:gamma-glutamylcyclotransferase (GGCT)/AIG2-like uncharacterized protein YtfP